MLLLTKLLFPAQRNAFLKRSIFEFSPAELTNDSIHCKRVISFHSSKNSLLNTFNPSKFNLLSLQALTVESSKWIPLTDRRKAVINSFDKAMKIPLWRVEGQWENSFTCFIFLASTRIRPKPNNKAKGFRYFDSYFIYNYLLNLLLNWDKTGTFYSKNYTKPVNHDRK